MVSSFRFTAVFFLLGMLLAVSIADTVGNPIDVEDIKDPEMKHRIAQALAAEAEDGETEEPDARRPPPPSLISEEKRLPYPICGVFILCERKGGFYGFPDAQLIKGFRTRIFPRTTGACQTRVVAGTCERRTSNNHARLWPLFGEEFNEMCFYIERKHSCTTGQVYIADQSGNALYKCDPHFDAHTVQFCLSKYAYYCRFRNPASIIFSTSSPATS